MQCIKNGICDKKKTVFHLRSMFLHSNQLDISVGDICTLTTQRYFTYKYSLPDISYQFFEKIYGGTKQNKQAYTYSQSFLEWHLISPIRIKDASLSDMILILLMIYLFYRSILHYLRSPDLHTNTMIAETSTTGLILEGRPRYALLCMLVVFMYQFPAVICRPNLTLR